MNIPHIICLIGSTRFKEAYELINRQETLAGRIVLSCGVFDHTGLSDQQRLDLNELHKRKIDLSDSVLVINVEGYIGKGTRQEIDYAKKVGKPISYLVQCEETIGNQGMWVKCYLGKGHNGGHVFATIDEEED